MRVLSYLPIVAQLYTVGLVYGRENSMQYMQLIPARVLYITLPRLIS